MKGAPWPKNELCKQRDVHEECSPPTTPITCRAISGGGRSSVAGEDMPKGPRKLRPEQHRAARNTGDFDISQTIPVSETNVAPDQTQKMAKKDPRNDTHEAKRYREESAQEQRGEKPYRRHNKTQPQGKWDQPHRAEAVLHIAHRQCTTKRRRTIRRREAQGRFQLEGPRPLRQPLSGETHQLASDEV